MDLSHGAFEHRALQVVLVRDVVVQGHAARVASGEITACIERSVALPEVPEAMRHLGAGRTRGKHVVEIA